MAASYVADTEELRYRFARMVISATTAAPPGPARDHQFHRLTIKRVVRETADATSFVLDVPAELRDAFAYEAGQFCTFRARVNGEQHLRCYSMSSSPVVDAELQVTVKRVRGGIVSNWMNDSLGPGDLIEVTCPAGVFRLGEVDRDVVAFAGGSGITPVLSLLKTALATTSRRIQLLYANRDPEAVIFDAELEALVERYADRLQVTHHFDVDRGFIDGDEIRPFVDVLGDAEFYVCGPGPFMDVIEATLRTHGVPAERIRIERFTPLEPTGEERAADETPAGTRLTIELDGRTAVADHRKGTTILQTARQLGMSPPFSCESGSCATCTAKIVEGAVMMHVNNALTESEVAEGWVLTCQSVPITPSVRVVYCYEEG